MIRWCFSSFLAEVVAPFLLLGLTLGRHNLDLIWRSPDTINGHTLHDRFVIGTGNISFHVGLHLRQCLVRSWGKKVELLGQLDRLRCIELTEQRLQLACLVVKK